MAKKEPAAQVLWCLGQQDLTHASETLEAVEAIEATEDEVLLSHGSKSNLTRSNHLYYLSIEVQNSIFFSSLG